MGGLNFKLSINIMESLNHKYQVIMNVESDYYKQKLMY